MRLAYVAPRWDYGDPERGLSLEETTFHSALLGMGHDVEHFDFLDRASTVGRAAMNQELLAFMRDVEPEFAFFVLFKDEIVVETIEQITASGVTTCNWFTDDHWRFDSFSRHYAPAFSLVVTTDEAAVAKYQAIGYDRAMHSQWACNTHAYAPRMARPLHEVTFVGQKYGDRPKAIDAIRRAGYSVECYGFGWERGRLDHDEMVDLFGLSRINLNFSKSYRGRLWRRRPLTFQIKARIFEVAGCGGFVLTEQAPGLDRYFELGTEIDTFDDPSAVVEKVRYWLEDEERRAAVARRGYERILREHTYEHRFAEIFRAAGVDEH